MIFVQRLAEPKALTKNGQRWLNELRIIKSNVHATKKQIDQAINKYRHHDIKKGLVEMFHGKCAYCESKITIITYGNIEHFRPKSIYEDLTFNWTNLLLACDICNDTAHKSNHFPLDANNEPLLIDPTRY
jgi:uncharacterized protein (TIGR02646 family)